MDNDPWADPPQQKGILLNIRTSDLPDREDIKTDYKNNNLLSDVDKDIAIKLREIGLDSSGDILIDGNIHRIPVLNKPNDKTSGWYVFNEVSSGAIFGNFGSWISGEKCDYSSIDQWSLTGTQKREFESFRNVNKKKCEEEQERIWSQGSEAAQKVYSEATEVNNFKYLVDKKLSAKVKLSQHPDHYYGSMIIPAYDENGSLSTLQFIDETGHKKFLKNGRKKGCCHILPGEDKTIYIVEGFATGLTVAKATGAMVVVAFDAGNLVDVSSKVKNKYTKSEIVIAGDNDHEKAKENGKNVGKEAAEKAAALIGVRVEIPPSIDGVSDFNDLFIANGLDAVKDIFENSLDKLFSARPVKEEDFKDLKPRQFLSGRHLIRGFVSATVAPPGVGKSTLSMQEAIGLATRRQTTADIPKKRLKVLLINLEDGLDEMRIRVAAMCKHYSIALSEFEDCLFLNSGRDMKLKIAEYTDRGKVTINPVVDAIKATINKNKIDVVIFDPFVRSHYVDENSNKDIDLVMEEFTRIAEVTNCAIDLVHHTSKPARAGGSGPADANHARGASSFIGAVRSARMLSEMTLTEADKFGVKEDQRRWYVRVDNVKSNLTPPSSSAHWYKRISVKTEFKDEDGIEIEIGVLEEWIPEDINLMIFSQELLTEIKEIVQKGLPNGDKFTSYSQASKRWLGFAIAHIFDNDPQKDKKYLSKIINELITRNILVEKEIKTAGGDKSKGLFVFEL